MTHTSRRARLSDCSHRVSGRMALAIVSLAIGALACSLGGSPEPTPERTGGGVPVSKATSSPVEQAPTATEAVVEPTSAPQPTQAPAQAEGSIQVEPSNSDIPFTIVDLNVRMGVLVPVLFGLVQNVGDAPLGSVEITIIFLDEQKNVVGASSGYTSFKVISPGELSPFEVNFPDVDPEAVHSVGLGADWNPDYGVFPNIREGFNLEGVQGAWGEFGRYEISGTLNNINAKPARYVDVAIIFYNSAGKLIGLYVDRVFDIAAGGSDFFTISVVDTYFTEPEIDHFEILLEGSLEE